MPCSWLYTLARDVGIGRARRFGPHLRLHELVEHAVDGADLDGAAGRPEEFSTESAVLRT